MPTQGREPPWMKGWGKKGAGKELLWGCPIELPPSGLGMEPNKEDYSQAFNVVFPVRIWIYLGPVIFPFYFLSISPFQNENVSPMPVLPLCFGST